MYAYYVNRGHTLDSLLSLSYVDKLFFLEAMNYEIEQEQEKYKAMSGK